MPTWLITKLLSHEPLKEAVCISVIMTVYGIGQERWSNMIGHSKKSATVKHGNTKNYNATIHSDNPIIRNLVSILRDWIVTRTVRERQEKSCHKIYWTQRNTKYLPPLMSKRDSYKDYALKSGYKVTFDNHSHAISKWVGNVPDPERGIISFTLFCQYWKENHGNIVASIPSKGICSLCHDLSNQNHSMICFSSKRQMKWKVEEIPQTPTLTIVTTMSKHHWFLIHLIGTLMMKHHGRWCQRSNHLQLRTKKHVPANLCEVETKE